MLSKLQKTSKKVKTIEGFHTKRKVIDSAMGSVEAELARAIAEYPPMNSAHEAYAVLKEEVEEFWAEVKKQPSAVDKEKMRKELIQVAAMAIRTIIDVIDKE